MGYKIINTDVRSLLCWDPDHSTTAKCLCP